MSQWEKDELDELEAKLANAEERVSAALKETNRVRRRASEQNIELDDVRTQLARAEQKFSRIEEIQERLARHTNEVRAKIHTLRANAANGFDLHASKLREMIDERITDRIGTQKQFRDAVRSLVEDALEEREGPPKANYRKLCLCGHYDHSHDGNGERKCCVARTDTSTNYKTVKCDCSGFHEVAGGEQEAFNPDDPEHLRVVEEAKDRLVRDRNPQMLWYLTDEQIWAGEQGKKK